MGNKGNFYCGRSIDYWKPCIGGIDLSKYSVDECNGVCGPSDGCNCISCHELDVTLGIVPFHHKLKKSKSLSEVSSNEHNEVEFVEKTLYDVYSEFVKGEVFDEDIPRLYESYKEFLQKNAGD